MIDVNRIKDAVDMVDVLHMYGYELNRAGKMCCPFHNEYTPSFGLFADNKRYHCFGCGASGDAIKFVQEIDGITFAQAIYKLASYAGISIDTNRPTVAESKQAAARRREREERVLQRCRLNTYRQILARIHWELWCYECWYAPKSPDEAVDRRYINAIKRRPYIKYLIDEVDTEYERLGRE